MKTKNLKTDMIMVTIISFIGFWFEDIWMVFRHGVLDNRNMYLPFLIGYGLAVVAIYYVIGTPNKIFNKYDLRKPFNFILYALLMMMIVSVGEVVLGTTVEKVLGYKYWNYEKIPLHITSYTSIPTSIGFSIVITLFMHFIYEPLRVKVDKISNKIPMFIFIILIIVFIIDNFFSFRQMYINGGRNMVWFINFR